MTILDRICAAARQHPARIVLPEGEDARVIGAALRALHDGIAKPVLIGDVEAIGAAIRSRGDTAEGLDIIDPAGAARAGAYAATYRQLRARRGVDMDAACKAMLEPLVFAAMMVREGDADGTIGGAVHSSADTIRVAFQVIGAAPGVDTVSSFFLMVPRDGGAPLMFADCALVIDPDAAQLSQIALSTAASFRAFGEESPRVAMLSFSTLGSANHPRARTVAEATALVREDEPGLIVDGEIQFDAATVPSVATAKAPGSPLEGAANVFVFPNLEAGNIGYKIAQRIGGMTAIGPILQGLAKPANDLSRGCSEDDVYNLIAVTVMQANAARGG